MKLSKQFPLNALRVFEAVGRLGSFTRAGEELGMTQTAVSYQIKLLEDNIGEMLFLRKPRQIELTDTGARLLPKVSEAFGLMVDAVASARHASGETLEIHSIPTFATQWLAKHLGSFQLDHSNIAVRLLRVNKITDFARDGADIAIRWGDGPWPGLVSHQLIRATFTPMLSPKLADSIGGVHQPSDLMKLPIISPDDHWWKEWFSAAGVQNLALKGNSMNTFEAQDLEASAAIAGQGVAIISPFFFREELASGRLLQPFPLACAAHAPIWMVYPHARRNAPKIRAFQTWIDKALASDEMAATLAPPLPIPEPQNDMSGA